MLKQISCDKFLEKGKIREPIIFHLGLNTVMGSENAANSIGKSTFLLIFDFIFGFVIIQPANHDDVLAGIFINTQLTK